MDFKTQNTYLTQGLCLELIKQGKADMMGVIGLSKD